MTFAPLRGATPIAAQPKKPMDPYALMLFHYGADP
ncbi:MAG: hypothetical protein RLZZ303_1474 [Candidatus Hydrogenedentota bacterium]